MKKPIVEIAIFVLILLAGTALFPRRNQLAALTINRIRQKAQALGRSLEEDENMVRVIRPRIAAYLEKALLGIALIVAFLAVHLLIVVPVQVYSIRRSVSRLEAEMATIRSEISETTLLLSGLAHRFQVSRSIEEGAIVSKPRPPGVVFRKDPSEAA